MSNKEVIENFYKSFSRGDAEGMINCYDTDIEFTDPAFGTLKGEDAKNMWRMLMKRSGGKIKITFSNINAGEKTGSANWKAEYVYSGTGRNVVNTIAAQFEFRNGKIIRHADHFSLWKWSRQALGWKGLMLGWTPMMKNRIQKQTSHLLKTFSEKGA